MNHTSLLKAVLLHSGIPEELHEQVYTLLGDTQQKKSQIKTRLYSLSLSDRTVDMLYNLIEQKGPHGKMASMLRCITKKQSQVNVNDIFLQIITINIALFTIIRY